MRSSGDYSEITANYIRQKVYKSALIYSFAYDRRQIFPRHNFVEPEKWCKWRAGVRAACMQISLTGCFRFSCGKIFFFFWQKDQWNTMKENLARLTSESDENRTLIWLDIYELDNCKESSREIVISLKLAACKITFIWKFSVLLKLYTVTCSKAYFPMPYFAIVRYVKPFLNNSTDREIGFKREFLFVKIALFYN